MIAWLLALVGVASVTVKRLPCNEPVVASAAELAFHYHAHVDIVCTFAHDEYGLMADLAFEPDTVKPVREYNRLYPGLLHT